MKTHLTVSLFSCVFLPLIVNCSPVQSQYEPTAQDDKTCRACKALVDFSTRLKNNFGEEVLVDKLTDFCTANAELEGKQTRRICSFMMRDLLGMLKNANPVTFCDEISACQSDLPVERFQVTNVGNNETCKFCQDVVKNVKEIVSGEETEYQVKALISDFCLRLGNFENECNSLLDEYIDTLFQFARNKIQSLPICQALHACPQSLEQVQRLPDLLEVVNIFQPEMPVMAVNPEVNSIGAEQEEPESPISDIQCVLCKKIVNLLIQELKDNRTAEAIESALEDVCQLVPKSKRDECQSFVERYTDELIHILTEETDPDLACTLMGVCVPQLNKHVSPEIEREYEEESLGSRESTDRISWVRIQPAEEVKPDHKYCFECEMLMHFVQTEMYDFKSQQQIEEFVEKELCDKMKVVVMKESCDEFVKQYGPAIIELIAQRVFDPNVVCQKELRLCPNSTHLFDKEEATTQIPTTTAPSLTTLSLKCDLCVSIVQKLDYLLEDSTFDKEIANIIEHACSEVPKTRQDQCTAMVEAYVPYFLQMIGRLSDAKHICKSIDVCLTAGHAHLLGGHKCTYGPEYWCHTFSHAEACQATDFCKTKVWKPIEN